MISVRSAFAQSGTYARREKMQASAAREIALEELPRGVDQLVRVLGADVTAPHHVCPGLLQPRDHPRRLRVVRKHDVGGPHDRGDLLRVGV